MWLFSSLEIQKCQLHEMFAKKNSFNPFSIEQVLIEPHLCVDVFFLFYFYFFAFVCRLVLQSFILHVDYVMPMVRMIFFSFNLMIANMQFPCSMMWSLEMLWAKALASFLIERKIKTTIRNTATAEERERKKTTTTTKDFVVWCQLKLVSAACNCSLDHKISLVRDITGEKSVFSLFIGSRFLVNWILYHERYFEYDTIRLTLISSWNVHGKIQIVQQTHSAFFILLWFYSFHTQIYFIRGLHNISVCNVHCALIQYIQLCN